MNQSPSASDQVSEAWRRHRPYLVNLAYQMLGDIGEAEDIAQEAFLRLSRADISEIEDTRGWLTVVASRLCLDQVRSARARYERPGDIEDPPAPRRVDPADRVTLDDEIRTALLEVLRRLSPGERVAFVLHDVFGVPFESISQTVGRPVGTCRQLARRARSKFEAAQPKLADVAPAEHQLVTEKFIAACANGDLQALAAVLDPTVWGVGTILADPAPPPQINHGPDAVATNLLRYLWPDVTLVSGPVGGPVLLAFSERRLFAVIVLTIRESRVMKIEAIADPSARA
ncbi:RNA polymerase subunit sigma [Mycobacterium colombiense]|uniref:RNA polymerase sigma factor SigI n=1 Tax=Mycobacterium colombiense TaxID=339268 RepID=UPI0007FEA279|nr:RNA polymerase sigma factor SigI [Mycobacterium colombiense]OBJ25151.1 RNA polymerase subunit sigma [Mycobacterium colombiense]OBJ25223.1 RNA polymerase subunit sigma [Mycobacterium colombiense]OBJ76315.1 RNA polymerase subunit sigma [Mycobacterium colombiense]OMB91920.1 RNA polymerase subunit sigma [Mycobacterium colombiense]OMC26362.1 RNA polymerase subunit sigma [Mycobacterium colombiense]